MEKINFKKNINRKNNNIISLCCDETRSLILKYPELKKQIIDCVIGEFLDKDIGAVQFQ